MIATRCDYMKSWTNYDTYNTAVLIFGMLFLLAGCILSLVGVTRGDSSLYFLVSVLLLDAFIFITVSTTLSIGRFLILIQLLKYSHKE